MGGTNHGRINYCCSLLSVDSETKDGSIPSQVPRDNTTQATGIYLLQVEYIIEEEEEHKILFSLSSSLMDHIHNRSL